MLELAILIEFHLWFMQWEFQFDVFITIAYIKQEVINNYESLRVNPPKALLFYSIFVKSNRIVIGF